MVQRLPSYRTLGCVAATYVSHSCGFDQIWYRKATTCPARPPRFRRSGLHSHTVRGMFGKYSTESSSFRWMLQRWYVYFFGECRVRPTTPNAQTRRPQTGLPEFRVRMSCPLVPFPNGDVLLAKRWSVRGAPRKPPEPAQEPGMAISPPHQSLLRACLSSPLFRKADFLRGYATALDRSPHPHPPVVTAARFPASLPSTRSR